MNVPRVALLIGGLAVGVFVGIGAFALFGDDGGDEALVGDPVSSSFPPVEHDDAASQALVDAWERWRTATFFSRGSWTRTLDDNPSLLSGPMLRVQAPPRRLTLRLGSVVERIDGAERLCDASTDVLAPPCTVGEQPQSYEERVVAEIELVRSFVLGPERIYSVNSGGGGCWQAELQVNLLAAPWGRWAEFCFDPGIGALVSSRIRRPSAVDLEEVIELRGEVTDEDFSLG